MFATIAKLFHFLEPRSRLQIGLLLVPMLTIAVLEMASIGLILPFIQVILLGETDGRFTRILIAVLPNVPDDRFALWVAGSFGAFFLGKNALLLAIIYVINRVIYFKSAHFMARMFGLYLGRPLTFHFRHNSAEILRNLLSGCGHSFEALRLSLLMMLDSLLMAAAALLLLLVEPVTTLAVAATFILLGVGYYRVAAPLFQHWGEREMVIEGEMIKWIRQGLSSIRDVKLLDAYGFLNGKVGQLADGRAGVISRSTTALNVPRLMIETVVVIGFLFLVLALLELRQSSTDVIAILGLYGMAALRLMPSLNRLLANATELKHRTAYIDTLYKDLVEGRRDTDRPREHKIERDLPFEREIRIEGLSYLYPDSVHHALHGVDLSIAKGESVGIVGPSGAGKTTLVDITLGLLRPQSGRVLIDGRDAFANTAAWQRRIGFVPQNVQLIDDSLRRNIAFGLEDNIIDEARIEEVVRLARLDDVVAQLPDGLGTVIGEDGARLSGGQQQRMAIARVLYREPDVLVFDEATSALDNESEREIAKVIENLAGKKTVLIIAHRLSSVRNCDKLVFMKTGRVAAIGSFDELFSSNSEFRHLVELGNLGTESEESTRTSG